MRLKRWGFFLICLMGLPLLAQRAKRFDPEADIALAFKQGAVVLEVPSGAHLKAAFMEIKLQKGQPGSLKVGPLPSTDAKDELDEGIWHGTIRIPVKGNGLRGNVTLLVTYQPCTEGQGGVCFPPMDRPLSVKASEIPSITPSASVPSVKESASSAAPAPIETTSAPTPTPPAKSNPTGVPHGFLWMFLAAFAWGLAASLTPCVYPMIPITMAIIGAKGGGRTRGFLLSLTLVLGMVTTYTTLGVVAARTGSALGAFAQHPGFLIPVSLLFGLFALSLFGMFEIRLPDSWQQRLQGSGPRKGHLGAFFMGLVLGPLSAPCVGPFVGTVLVAIAKEGRVVLGALQLFTFSLGMGVLFILVGTFSAALPRSGEWLVKLKQFLGVLVLGFAIWNVRLLLPFWLELGAEGLLLLIVAAALDVFRSANGLWEQLRKAIAILCLVLGMLFGIQSVETRLHLELLPRTGTARVTENESWRKDWLRQDFEGALRKAEVEQKMILVDVYADWCAECKELDAKTWPDPAVASWIQTHAVAVSVDTYRVRKDLAIKFQVVGYPTVFLMDSKGQELRRIEGFQKPEAMLKFLNGQS